MSIAHDFGSVNELLNLSRRGIFDLRRYAQSLPDAVNRVTPSFNHSAADHVPWVANLPPVTVQEAAKFDEDFRDRWRSLMSVDDLVEGEPP